MAEYGHFEYIDPNDPANTLRSQWGDYRYVAPNYQDVGYQYFFSPVDTMNNAKADWTKAVPLSNGTYYTGGEDTYWIMNPTTGQVTMNSQEGQNKSFMQEISPYLIAGGIGLLGGAGISAAGALSGGAGAGAGAASAGAQAGQMVSQGIMNGTLAEGIVGAGAGLGSLGGEAWNPSNYSLLNPTDMAWAGEQVYQMPTIGNMAGIEGLAGNTIPAYSGLSTLGEGGISSLLSGAGASTGLSPLVKLGTSIGAKALSGLMGGGGTGQQKGTGSVGTGLSNNGLGTNNIINNSTLPEQYKSAQNKNLLGYYGNGDKDEEQKLKYMDFMRSTPGWIA